MKVAQSILALGLLFSVSNAQAAWWGWTWKKPATSSESKKENTFNQNKKPTNAAAEYAECLKTWKKFNKKQKKAGATEIDPPC